MVVFLHIGGFPISPLRRLIMADSSMKDAAARDKRLLKQQELAEKVSDS
jgi:hypothetical protein